MENKTPCIVVGVGTVGGCLVETLKTNPFLFVYHTIRRRDYQNQRDILFAIKSSVTRAIRKFGRQPIVFLCTPSNNSGRFTKEVLVALLRRRIAVVTCEKAALAYHYNVIHDICPMRFGFSATVGGATRMINAVSCWLYNVNNPDNVDGWFVLNSTLNHAFTFTGDIQDMVSDAKQKGIMESGGGDDYVQSYISEIRDAEKKAAILYNDCFAGNGRKVNPNKFFSLGNRPEKIRQLLDERKDWRFVVRIRNDVEIPAVEREKERILSFCYDGEDFRIWGGFYKLSSIPECVRESLPTGINNAAIFRDGEHAYTIAYGAGAKPIPTVAAMVGDALSMTGHTY